MPLVTTSSWLLGWDAEARLEQPADWITPAIELMERDRRVFCAGPNWPERGEPGGSLPRETIESAGPFCLNWNFSDQAFLVRRESLLAPIYRSFCPGAWWRQAGNPLTFESRVESYLRVSGHFRATHAEIRHTHGGDGMAPVVQRLGDERVWEHIRRRLLDRSNEIIGSRIPTDNPRWRSWPRQNP